LDEKEAKRLYEFHHSNYGQKWQIKSRHFRNKKILKMGGGFYES
jgi:hypothetical protein